MPSQVKSFFGFAKKGAPTAPVVRKQNTSTRGFNGFVNRIIFAADRMAFAWPIREALYRHLSAQVSNGVAVEVALDTFRARLQRRKKISADKIVADVARRMRDGGTVAGSLKSWIPLDESSVISSGELSGNLPRALDLVIEAKRRIARVNSALKTSMVSPAIYLCAVYAMLWAIGKYVTPGLEQALPPEKARGLVAGLYAAGAFANSLYALIPPIIAAVVFVVVILSLPRWTGRARIAAEGMFPYSFYRDIQGYTWLMSFSALLRAGVADVEILKRQKVQSTPWLRERLAALWWRMENGSSLPEALYAKGNSGLPAFDFPNPDVVDDIASMAGFADFPERIATLAIQWADEIETSMLRSAKAFGFVLEIAMYVVMGLLMLAINSMSTQIGGSGPGF